MPVQRGEVYLVNLNPVQGREQAGHRPVLGGVPSASRQPGWARKGRPLSQFNAREPVLMHSFAPQPCVPKKIGCAPDRTTLELT
jgi:PemK-like, MazF-like toxin of type II toxin-antitoxin system